MDENLARAIFPALPFSVENAPPPQRSVYSCVETPGVVVGVERRPIALWYVKQTLLVHKLVKSIAAMVVGPRIQSMNNRERSNGREGPHFASERAISRIALCLCCCVLTPRQREHDFCFVFCGSGFVESHLLKMALACSKMTRTGENLNDAQCFVPPSQRALPFVEG